MLRNAVVPCVNEPYLRCVAELLQLLLDRPDDEEVVVESHVGNVLHEDHARADPLDHVKVRAPQLLPAVLRVASMVLDEVADLVAPRPAERLAGRSSCDEIDLGGPEDTFKPVALGGVTEVHLQAEAREVRPVGFQRTLVEVHCCCCGPSRPLDTGAEAAGAREEVHGQPLALAEAFQPVLETLQGAAVLVRIQLEVVTALKRYAVVPFFTAQPFVRVASTRTRRTQTRS